MCSTHSEMQEYFLGLEDIWKIKIPFLGQS